MTSAATPRFQPGDVVRVRADTPRGHCRTPGYVRGQVGRVTQQFGAYPNPESCAYGGDGLPKQPIYQVEFPIGKALPEYRGSLRDTVRVDIYQNWLEPAGQTR